MKKIILRFVLTVLVLVCLRLIYVKVFKVPFFEQVFISTAIGLIFSQIVLELVLNKLKIDN